MWGRRLGRSLLSSSPKNKMDVKLQAVQHYVAKGLPLNGSIALAVVFYAESELRPGSQGVQGTEHGGALNDRGAYGIMSLNGPRQARYKNWADRNHIFPYDQLIPQLDFALNEIANYYPKSWQAIRSQLAAESIVPTIVSEYENPKDIPGEVARANALVAPLLMAYHEAGPAPAPGPVVPTVPPSVPASVPPTQGFEDVPIATLITIFTPIIESIVTGVLNAHGVRAPSAPAPAPIQIHVPPPPPPPPPAATGPDWNQIAQMIATELGTELGKLQQTGKL
jgi:hypothetical protein